MVRKTFVRTSIRKPPVSVRQAGTTVAKVSELERALRNAAPDDLARSFNNSWTFVDKFVHWGLDKASAVGDNIWVRRFRVAIVVPEGVESCHLQSRHDVKARHEWLRHLHVCVSRRLAPGPTRSPIFCAPVNGTWPHMISNTLLPTLPIPKAFAPDASVIGWYLLVVQRFEVGSYL
jgi:hypothetical protein